jgi:hypothetical protein
MNKQCIRANMAIQSDGGLMNSQGWGRKQLQNDKEDDHCKKLTDNRRIR